MKKYLVFLVLLAPSVVHAQQTTQQFCDGQANAVAILTPVVKQFADYAVVPFGGTQADVETTAITLVRMSLGEKCVMMRLADTIGSLQTQLTTLQAQVAALQGQVPAAVTAATNAQTTVTAMQQSVSKLQTQVKAASSALG